MTLGFETILPFLRPIEHLIRDDSISEIMVDGSTHESNIADSLNILIQLERRPGKRFVSEVLEIRGYNSEADRYDLPSVFTGSFR